MDFSFLAIDPIAISIGGLKIRWYGILIATGIALAYFLAQRESVKRGLHPELIADLLIWAVPISIISARIYYVLMSWNSYAGDFGKVFRIWEGGIAIHGALIGAFITTYVFCKKRNVSFLQIADIAAPGILIGQIIGRWGNFVNQEAHGGPVTREFLEGLFLPDWIINQMYIPELASYVHPTFLYESLWNLVALIILLLVRQFANWRRGEMFFFYIIWYSVGRYFIEALRTDSLYLIEDVLRSAQVVSIIGVVVGVAAILYNRKKIQPPVRYKD